MIIGVKGESSSPVQCYLVLSNATHMKLFLLRTVKFGSGPALELLCKRPLIPITSFTFNSKYKERLLLKSLGQSREVW
jgi:hypothetical protein